MTSEAYVWVYLPGDTHPTVCGRFSHSPSPSGLPVGTFVYGASYLNNSDAIALDPFALPLLPKEYKTNAQGGVFGVIVDALPDDWGRYVIDRTRGVQKFPVGYMLHTMDDSIGNLAFSSSHNTPPTSSGYVDFDLVPQAREILLGLEEGKPIPKELEDRIKVNTAMGGARPKLTIEYNGHLWLAKFPSKNDVLPYAKIEAAMLDLANRCGVNAAEGFVTAGDVLLVRRFDRAWMKTGWRRESFLSARTLFHSNLAAQTYTYGGSYARLARELTRFSAQGQADQKELFRRMAFNAAISNTDDHDRNHGMIADDMPGTFRLSPAYDLVPQIHSTQRKYHAMILGGSESLVSKSNILADCRAFGLDRQEAERILDDVIAQVDKHWETCLREQGVDDGVIARLTNCFANLPDDEPAVNLERHPFQGRI